LQRQAALVVDECLVAAFDDHRVDEGARPVLVRLEHEQAAKDADLRRRKAHALRLVHQHGHPVDEPPQIVVEVLDRVRDQAERGVAVLADLRERKPTPSLRLGLRASVFVRLVIVLVVVLVIVM